jgi:hypothetical protein
MKANRISKRREGRLQLAARDAAFADPVMRVVGEVGVAVLAQESTERLLCLEVAALMVKRIAAVVEFLSGSG